jgi:hypothetical protein
MSIKGDQAHTWAGEIYTLSTQCLMAHSVRAVEHYLEHRIDNLDHRRPHRINITESTPMFYLGKRAVAYIFVGRTEIKVDKDLGFEEKRMAIAHELGHVLFAKSNFGNNTIAVDRDTEDSCKIFEKALCKHHHDFYCDPNNISRIKFPSLDEKSY